MTRVNLIIFYPCLGCKSEAYSYKGDGYSDLKFNQDRKRNISQKEKNFG